MNNELMTLDGLIQRLTELRENAGTDCPIIIGKSFDSTKEQLTITMVSLDLYPQAKKQEVAILVEPKSYIEKKEQPEHSFIATIYRCGKNPHWSIGDTLAYYEFTSDCEGEIVLGKVTNVEFDEEYDDWLYTFEDGDQCDEESLLNYETYKKTGA